MEQLEFLWFPRKRPKAHVPKEWKVVALRDCPLRPYRALCDNPGAVAAYWREHIVSHPYFNSDVECFVAIHLDTRRRVTGHHLVGVGILDSVIVHAREVFRTAIIAGAHAVIVAHNHPSGDPTPSDADIRTTKDLVRAGQLLKVELLDHVVMGTSSHNSLKEMGLLYS
ncbi:MAG: JAB domain-containing protein [Verrucomicrobiota bacterium]